MDKNKFLWCSVKSLLINLKPTLWELLPDFQRFFKSLYNSLNKVVLPVQTLGAH